MNPVGWIQGLEGATLAAVLAGFMFVEEAECLFRSRPVGKYAALTDHAVGLAPSVSSPPAAVPRSRER
jgi:hypothetical protein